MNTWAFLSLASRKRFDCETQSVALFVSAPERNCCCFDSALQTTVASSSAIFGRLIFIHLQCWEVLPFCHFRHQRCIKFLCPKDPDFYTPLALKTAKGQHLPALEVYKNQSPAIFLRFLCETCSTNFAIFGHGEVRVYRGTGVSRGVRRTTWDRSLENWELQIPCFEEFFWGGNTLGLVPASLRHTLGYACTFYAPTSPSLAIHTCNMKTVQFICD